MTIHFNNRTKLAITISIVLSLMTFTFETFFFFNPFAFGVTLLATVQFVSLVGWVALILVPPIILLFKKELNKSLKSIFLIAALVWPITLLAIRVIILINGQGLALSYLFDYPVFIFSDIIAPVIYIFMWKKLPTKKSPTNPRRFSLEVSNQS